ncbi:MAG: heparinase II/III family protein [Clostridia bacterium]|nr:heparinase II/III family protein [Clostridia bacterium]
MKKVVSIILSLAMLVAAVGTIPFTASAASMSDATFFAKFDYSSYPGLAAVKAAVDAGDYDTAKTELVNYFIERKNEGTVSAFEITEADENYGMAVLPLDNILTGPYEFDVWLNRFTVTSMDYTQYEIDLTEKVSAELSNQAISVMLFERQKQAFPVYVASKEYAGYEPVLVIETAEGNTYTILPDNDTYIHSGNTTTTYGDAEVLEVKEQSDSDSSPFGAQTRRAYINFPLTEAANQTVTKATMKLYAKLASDCTLESLDVHVISVGDTTWSEDTLTWDGINGNIYSYQSAENPTWQSPSGADGEYLNVTARFWYGRAMAYEYLSYLEDPEGYAEEHPLYPDGSVFGEKLISLMDAFANQVSYGYNRTLETGERLNRWVDILDALVDTPAVTENPDKFCNILSFIWGDCNYLSGLDITNGSVWWSNWRIVANAGFFKAVEYLPEFSTYSTWRDKVEYNVEYTMDLLYNDDMSFTEAGPSYAVWCAQLFGDCARIAEQNGHPMTQSFKEKLRYAARYAAEVIYPDGYDSNIGDSNYRDQMAVFEDLAEFYGNDSILNAFVSGSDEGAEYYSSIYEDVNTALFRNSWDPDETVYVQFNNNPSDGHYHPDSNQVIMYAYGKPLLVDSGRYGYSGSSLYTQLRYASAHNTIEAVGVSMGTHSSAANEFEYSTTNSTLGFATTTQNGYSGVDHTRNVLYLAEGYSIVTDYVDGSDSSQEYRQNWHFMPSSNVEMDGNTATTNFYNEANIIVANAGSDSAVIRDGYHSADYGLVASSKYASYSKTGEDVKFDTVLYPVKANESAEVSVTDLAEDDNSKAALAITINGNTGYYYVKNTDESDGTIPNVKIPYNSIITLTVDFTTDAKMAYYAQNDDGTMTMALVDGTSLIGTYSLGSISAIESPTNISAITLTLDGTTLNIEGDSLVASTDTSDAIKIRDLGVETVTLNGEVIDFTTEGSYIYAVKSTSVAGTGDVSVSGKEYTIVDDTNLISNGDFSDGMTDWTDAATGATVDWTVSDNATYSGDSGYAATNKESAGGSAASTLRRFVEVEAGKQYYLSYNAYNTGSATTANGMMSAAVLTSGGPVYGSFTGLSYYNYNTYGGMNSWSAEAGNTQVGGSISRSDDLYSAGMNKKEFIFTVPEGATHLMLSFGAWTTAGQIYWSNFSLVEVEEIKDETDYAVVNISFVDSESNEIADPVTEDADEGTVYIYDAPESIEYDGCYYVLDDASSVLSAKVQRGENTITAVYKKSGLVTVKFVDLSDNEIAASVTYEAEIGSTFDGSDAAKSSIIYGSSVYTFVPTSTDSITVAEKISDNVIMLYYRAGDEEFDGLLGTFTFDDEETGFTADYAKATSNGTNVLSSDAKRGSSLYLDGTGANYLTITDNDGNSLLAGLEEMTITFYAKVTNTGTSWSVYMAPDTSAQSYQYENYIGMLHSGTSLTVERYNNSGARPTALSAATETNVWKKYALVIEEDQTTLYVDGTATTLASDYKLSDIVGDDGIFQVGKANWGSGEFFTGYIDEMSIYSRALSEQEINAAEQETTVKVNYVDVSGNTLLDSDEVSILTGVEISTSNIPYDKLIEIDEKYYVVSEITNLGTVTDGTDATVDVIYVEAYVTQTTYYATRGDSLRNDSGTTGMASESGDDYPARLMVDNRWYKRAGVMGFDVDADADSIVSAVVTVHVNTSGDTSGNSPSVTGPAIYSGAALADGWSRGNVSGFDLPDESIADGSVDSASEYVTFDVTDFVAENGVYDFALFTTTSNEYIIYDSELTDYVPTITILTAVPKLTSFVIEDGKAVYTSYDEESAAVVVAYFNASGELIKAVSAEGADIELEVAIEDVEGAASYTAYVWKSVESMIPVEEPIEVTISTAE